MGKWRRRIAASVAALLFGLASPCAAQDLATAVKATYLYKLAPFVTWPGEPARAEFNLCIIGHDPFGQVLDRAVSGQGYNGRPFRVLRLGSADAASVCDIAYTNSATTLKALQGAPVLTVTDTGAPPGMVAFVLHQGRVRFNIDQDQARDSGLTLSSKLLALALQVKGASQ